MPSSSDRATRRLRALLLLALPIAACECNEDRFVPEEIGRCADFDPVRRAYFGDLHVHTSFSLDANLQGTRLDPRDAYRVARGEAVGSQPYDENGNPERTTQLDRPLDFVAVSDHAEFLGAIGVCTTPGTPGYDDPGCVSFRENPRSAFFLLNSSLAGDQSRPRPPELCGLDGVLCEGPARDAWAEVRSAAEAAYDRTDACTFTSFVAYEWSGNPTFDSRNLHRNVIFRNEVTPDTPTGYFDESYPEGLWAALRGRCLDRNNGCDVLTIPHNSNLSGGMMFAETDRNGAPFSPEYAAERRAMEPLVEVFQHKGDSECMPGTSAGDELCGFEKLPYSGLTDANLDFETPPSPSDFIRHALGEGIRLEQTLGANPFEYGIIASTDTHIATPGNVSETTFPGHGGAGQSNSESVEGLTDVPAFNPGGLAVVWAEENSREAIFLALRRRETYGTSGPRIVLRFFAGFGYPEEMCDAADFAEQGYAGGVPMGGVLGTPPPGMAPSFAVSALRDAQGTALQRIQIIKGWVENDTTEYAVYEVAGDPNNGAGVDLGTCEPTGTGFDALCEVFTDPDFDPAVPAFYYARVLENPTCRWHTRACLGAPAFDCDAPETVPAAWSGCCDDRWEDVQQERAWSSPVWYRPAN